MKTLWARVGMSVDITEEEHTQIKQLIECGRDDEAGKILTELFVNRGYFSGDSYMPGNYCNCCEDNPNAYEFDLLDV